MAKKNDQAAFSKILDAWNPPDGGGDPVGCISTTFTFNPVFFETESWGVFWASKPMLRTTLSNS